ncbi:small integral membrane protein 8 isoform X2 [Vanacampus margaritifer]
MKKDTEQRYPLPSAFRKHFVVDMASNKTSKEKKGIETDYRTPGLRSAQTTTLFRAVNPELFVKPVNRTTEFCVTPPKSPGSRCKVAQMREHHGDHGDQTGLQFLADVNL